MLKPRNFIPLLLLPFLAAGVARAQSVGGAPDPVQFSIAPDAPGPNQLVNIEISGVGSFLGDATIAWQQNGKTVLSGAGERSFSFTTGGVGTQTRIHVVIDSSTQGLITRDFTFYPSLVHLVWEADTAVPPLYAGKALYSAGSGLRVVAFPIVMSGGALVPASRLSFQWKENGTPEPQQSGLGENVFSFSGSQLQSAEAVSVDVYLGATKVAQGDLSIPASDPKILFYYRDPLRGELLDAALPQSIALGSKEITVEAEPYFFSNASRQRGVLQYSWTLNGQETSGPESARGLLTLRQTGAGAGSAQLGVAIQNADTARFVQQAEAGLTLLFGQSGSSLSSFFGL